MDIIGEEVRGVPPDFSVYRIVALPILSSAEAQRTVFFVFCLDRPVKMCYDIQTEHTEGYRSGHNEAVLKTVWGLPTWVRIPHPPPKNPKVVDFRIFSFVSASAGTTSFVGIAHNFIVRGLAASPQVGGHK